jgi:hypothetical protein
MALNVIHIIKENIKKARILESIKEIIYNLYKRIFNECHDYNHNYNYNYISLKYSKLFVV